MELQRKSGDLKKSTPRIDDNYVRILPATGTPIDLFGQEPWTFLCEVVDNRKYSELSSIKKLIGNEVHAPYLLCPAEFNALNSMLCTPISARSFGP